MPEFVLNRNYNLVGKGHNIKFVKGAPTYVPPELAREAVGIGADVVGEKIDVLGEEDAPAEHLTPADRERLLFSAFETLIARNERGDFGGDGKPSIPELKRLVDFSLDKKERDTAFQKFRELKAEEAE